MLHPDKITAYQKLIPQLSLDDLLTLLGMTRPRTLAAGDIYIKEGSSVTTIGYVQQGLLRGYQINEKGIEVTLSLRWEDQLVGSHDTVLFQRPSRYFYQALEPTTILEVEYASIQAIMEKYPTYEAARYYFILNMLGAALTRVESFVLLTPEERYLQLINDKPGIVQRVPDKYIATLIGITPVSLSRIRKRIAAKTKH